MSYLSRPASREDLEKIVRKFPQARPLLGLPKQPIQIIVDVADNFVGIIAGFYCSNLTMAANGLDHRAVMATAEPISFGPILNVHIPVIFIEEGHRNTEAFSLLYDGFRGLLGSLVKDGARLGYVTATPGNAQEAAAYDAIGLKPHGKEVFLAATAEEFIGVRA